MSALWTSEAAAVATGGLAVGDWNVYGVSIDTRTLKRGDLFVALKDVRDGHDFVQAALDAGAGAALVSRRPEGVSDTAPLLLVDDVLAALEALGRAARERTDARVIAVTGSVGKTSTKEMLRSALAAQGRVHAAVMSLNNHWGVPLTLARMPRETDFALLEIGMNHPGEITPLSKMARPHVAVITTVAEAHMAAFDSVEDIARAKSEVFAGLEPGSSAVLNSDIGTYPILSAAVEKHVQATTFGHGSAADFRLESTSQTGGQTIVKTSIRGETAIFKLQAIGDHLAMNALSVLAAVEAVGGDLAIAAIDLGNWQPPAGRGARHWIALDPVERSQQLELIDDAYNANPVSMAAAFDVLAQSQPVDGLGRNRKGRRIAFLSDMLELGEEEAARHAALADIESVGSVDKIHLAGQLMHHLHVALPAERQGEWHETAASLAAEVHRLIDAGDVVMVKGSKGSKAALVVDAILKLSKASA